VDDQVVQVALDGCLAVAAVGGDCGWHPAAGRVTRPMAGASCGPSGAALQLWRDRPSGGRHDGRRGTVIRRFDHGHEVPMTPLPTTVAAKRGDQRRRR
jgi:hypothetical protein